MCVADLTNLFSPDEESHLILVSLYRNDDGTYTLSFADIDGEPEPDWQREVHPTLTGALAGAAALASRRDAMHPARQQPAAANNS